MASQPLAAQTIPAFEAGEEALVKMPVEVVGASGQREWILVEVSNQTIPEPGAAVLLSLSSLLLLRRRRGK